MSTKAAERMDDEEGRSREIRGQERAGGTSSAYLLIQIL